MVKIVRETTCDIYTIEIKTYDLEPDVQKNGSAIHDTDKLCTR